MTSIVLRTLRQRRVSAGGLVRIFEEVSEDAWPTPGLALQAKETRRGGPSRPFSSSSPPSSSSSSPPSSSSSSSPSSSSSSSSSPWGPAIPDNGDATAAMTLLRSLRAVDFLPHLMELKKTKTVMTMEDLEREFDMALPLASPEDGRRILTAMAESGLILKAGDVVYMDPGEIARTLRSVLPIDVPLIRRRLEEVEREVGPMRELKEAVEVRARRKSTAVNVGFLGFLSLQWGVFIRLCYWELSWDVVEPLGFFAGGLTTIVGFAWAVMTRRTFSYEALNGEVRNRWVDRALERRGFDFLAYDRLMRERGRLMESLRLAGEREGTGGATQKT